MPDPDAAARRRREEGAAAAGASRAGRGRPDPEVVRRLDRTAGAAPPLRRLLDARTGTVLAYAAAPGEPDLASLRTMLRENGIRVLLPVVAGPGELLWAAGHRPAAPGAGAARRPAAAGAGPGRRGAHRADLRLGPDDVALVPALAAGRDGARLGQGGGFYDRALADLPPHPDGPLVVAVVHDDELLAAGEVPSEPHDRRVDAVLTPSGWVALG